MKRQEIVNRLMGLRKEMEADGLLQNVELALLLNDVCNALGLDILETKAVLGQKTARAVEEWAGARLWQPAEMALRQAQDAETATVPPVELAAVPI